MATEEAFEVGDWVRVIFPKELQGYGVIIEARIMEYPYLLSMVFGPESDAPGMYEEETMFARTELQLFSPTEDEVQEWLLAKLLS